MSTWHTMELCLVVACVAVTVGYRFGRFSAFVDCARMIQKEKARWEDHDA